MKKTLLTILVLTIILGCQKKYSEKEKVVLTLKSIFENFENPSFKSFKEISTEKIYCIFCYSGHQTGTEPYMTDRKYFFENFMKKINEFDSFKKAKISNELIIINENNKRSDITAYLTTWKKGELADNHEGEQLGIYLKKVNGELKFSGIETIP